MLSSRLRTLLIYLFLRILHKLYYVGGRRIRYISVSIDHDEGLRIILLPQVFIPKYTLTQMVLCRILYNVRGKFIHELCSGSGLISLHLAQRNRVVASDIMYNAVLSTKLNAKVNKRWDNIDVIQMDKGNALRCSVFDIVVLNPPYLPLDARDNTDTLYCCGSNLKLLLQLIISSLKLVRKGGRVYVLVNDIVLDYVIMLVKRFNLKARVIPVLKTPLDRIFVVELEKTV